MTATSVDLTKLTPEEQRQNLLRVARDVLARPDTLDMEVYHDLTAEQWLLVQPFNFVSGKANSAEVAAQNCGTVHCIAGHAIANAGTAGFQLAFDHGDLEAGRMLLGRIAAEHFFDDNDDAFDFLRAVLAAEGKTMTSN